ncbi:crossover junction endodeoxyribonuclease RuvC [Deferribacter thermophilus]|uniref:crossover junction endodeoxyribonuclease RuvC n=1 Tax=Deferribacter thermophilus TaxID=53573 RepID=UPI003C18523E
MIIFGVDPGLNKTGIGVLELSENNDFKFVDYRLIKNKSSFDVVEKIASLSKGVSEIIEKYNPSFAAIEESFYSVNVKTAISLGLARGAIMSALLMQNVKVYQFTALQIKKSVVGYGKADKNQVRRMVEMQLNISLKDVLNDISDALACAICLAIFLKGNRYDKLY